MKNLLFILMLFIIDDIFAQTTVSITVLDNPEIRCKNLPIVKIKITPNPAQPYSEINVDWGDATAISTFTNNSPTPIITQHDYTASTLTFNACNYTCIASSFVDGFCRQISVLAKYNALIPDENVSKIITYHIPPIAKFMIIPNPACLGSAVSFIDQTCPVSSTMNYVWHFDDGTPDIIGVGSNTVPPAHTYTTVGTHTVTLTTTNSCGSSNTASTVTVYAPPIAAIRADSGFVMGAGGQPTGVGTNTDPYIICLGGGGRVKLDAAISQNETSYQWSAPWSGYTYANGHTTRPLGRYV